MNTSCSVPECPNDAAQKGWCWCHYYRWYRHGTTEKPHPFYSRIDFTGECWLWTAHVGDDGYAHYSGARSKTQLAHVVAYREFIGDVPEGLELDHLCRVRHCVNPFHLEPVTHQENVKRGLVWKKNCTKCGGEYIVVRRGNRDVRICRPCNLRQQREYYARNKEKWLKRNANQQRDNYSGTD